ncbi:MAG TPA: hypothetical protein VI010_13055, partial [Xanthobacteraceae bacterium]
HFANKEECILALFDEAATEAMRQMALADPGDAASYPEHLRLATRALGKLLGRVDVEDVLDVIFRDFCIGK